MLLVFINIVGSSKPDIFSTCVFNNIVGVACVFNSPFFPGPHSEFSYKPFIISEIRFVTNHPNLQ